MRIYIVAVVSLFLAAACGNENSAQKEKQPGENTEAGQTDYKFNKDKPYPYETGVIEYKYTGGLEGTQVVYFKDNGRTLSVEQDYVNKSAPVAARTHQLFI